MSDVGCNGVIVKILQYILSLESGLEITSSAETGPEIGVTFVYNNEICARVEASYCGPCELLLDIRSLLKNFGRELNVIKELQLKVAGSCLSVNQVFKHMRKSYILYYNSDVGWNLRTEEERFVRQYEEIKHCLSISLNVNLPIDVTEGLENSLLAFLKKCQLTKPYLTIVSSMNSKSYQRSGIYGLPKEDNWRKNVSLYLRTYGQRDFTTSHAVKSKHIRMTDTANQFQIIYGNTLGTDIGKENHLHVFLFSENGVPLSLQNRTWHDAVPLPMDINSRVTLQAGPCSEGMLDICYSVTTDGPIACYFVILFVKSEDDLKWLLEEHSDLVVSTIKNLLQEEIAAVVQHEDDKKWSHMFAQSIGSVIRFSQDNDFRMECLHLLEATDSLDAETKLECKLLSLLQKEN